MFHLIKTFIPILTFIYFICCLSNGDNLYADSAHTDFPETFIQAHTDDLQDSYEKTDELLVFIRLYSTDAVCMAQDYKTINEEKYNETCQEPDSDSDMCKVDLEYKDTPQACPDDDNPICRNDVNVATQNQSECIIGKCKDECARVCASIYNDYNLYSNAYEATYNKASIQNLYGSEQEIQTPTILMNLDTKNTKIVHCKSKPLQSTNIDDVEEIHVFIPGTCKDEDGKEIVYSNPCAAACDGIVNPNTKCQRGLFENNDECDIGIEKNELVDEIGTFPTDLELIDTPSSGLVGTYLKEGDIIVDNTYVEIVAGKKYKFNLLITDDKPSDLGELNDNAGKDTKDYQSPRDTECDGFDTPSEIDPDCVLGACQETHPCGCPLIWEAV
eukprot:361140_1